MAYQKRFVQDLADSGVCICGTHIVGQCEAIRVFLQCWIGGGRSDVEQALYRSAPTQLNIPRTHADSMMICLAERLVGPNAEAELRSVRERLSEARRKLGQIPDIDAAQLAQTRTEVQRTDR